MKLFACLFSLFLSCFSLQAQNEIWRSQDIGTVGTAGSHSYNSGTDTFTLAAAGSGLGGTADSFRHTWWATSGNTEIITKVNTLGSGNANARAGLMIRQELTTASAHATISVNPAGAVVFSYRTSSGGTTTTVSGTTDTAPVWLRLVRAGSSFKGYQSADGNTWTLVGTATIAMAGPIYPGMAVTSYNTASTTTATFDSNSLMVNVPQTGSSLKFWLRGDKDVTLTSSKVSQWDDQSGNGFHVAQATAGNRPTLASAAVSGLPAVRFNSANNTYLSVAHSSTLMSAKVSIFALAKLSSGTNGLIVEKFNSSTDEGYSLRFSSSSPVGRINANERSGSLSSNTFGVIQNIYDQIQNKLYVNGTLTTNTYTTATASNTIPLYLGSRAGAALRLDGDIAEVLIFNDAVSEDLRVEVESYLYSKYHTGTPPASAAPAFSVAGGTYSSTQNVALTAPAGALIFYTTNNTTPDYNSTLYTGPIAVSSGTTTIKAIAYRVGFANSAVSSATYIIDSVTAALPRSGLQLWLRADAGTDTVTDNTALSLWQDQSGNGVNVSQSTGANKPTLQTGEINSKPVVRFDGSNDFLQGNVTAGMSTPNETIVAVYRNANNGANTKILSRPYRNSGWTAPFIAWSLDASNASDGKPVSAVALSSSTASTVAAPSAVTLNTAQLAIGQYDGAVNRLFLNGSQVNSSSVSGSASYGNATTFCVGSRGTYSNGGYLNGDIAEVLFYDHALSDDERKNIEAYVYAKYNFGSAILSAPVLSVPSGTYTDNQLVTLTAASGASIYYTVDGSTPTTSSLLYTGPIPVSTFTVIKALAVKASFSNSGISSATIIIDPSSSMVTRSGLQLWLRSDSLIGTDGSSVSLWEDQSGKKNSAFQSNASYKPTLDLNTLNGGSTVAFSGSSQFLQVLNPLSFNIGTPTVIVVAQATDGTTGSCLAKNDVSTATSSRRKLQFKCKDTSFSFISGADGADTSQSIPDNAYNLMAVTSTAATEHTLYVNGQANGKTNALDLTSYNSSPLLVGGAFDGTAENFKGNIAEILVYDRALSRAELHEVEMYLSIKYAFNIDSDGDSIPDLWEEEHGTNPLLNEGTYTADADGLPDEWESEHFGTTAATEAGDFDHDGISNLDEYTNGSDPTDYYNGETPYVEIVSGNKQKGNPGAFTADPLVVRLWKPGYPINLAHAPVTFTVTNTAGGRALAPANVGPVTTFTSKTVFTDEDGYAVLEEDGVTPADIYFRLPSTAGESTVKVMAGTNTPIYFSFSALDDVDEDGMSDTWESAHGLNPLVDDSLDDKDGDRIPNLFEYKRGTLPNDAFSKPSPDMIVDQATGNDYTTDNVYAYVSEAVGKAAYGYWSEQTQSWQEPLNYPIVEVKSGVYEEGVLLITVPFLLLGELGPDGPPVIQPVESESDSNTLTIHAITAVVDGFVLTHAEDQTGPGLWTAPYSYDSTRSHMRLVNCLIKGNNSVYGAIANVGANLDLVHCTVTGNGGDLGQAVRVESGAQLNLINSIVWNNTLGSALVDISVATTEVVNVTTSIVTDGQFGGIDEDPLLGPNDHLSPGSPAIDRVGVVMVDAPSLDAQGEFRPVNGIPDLGWDEFNEYDSDNDGLPDEWELDKIGNLNSAPLDDDDEDGFNNYEEWIAGTDPLVADSNGDGIADGLSWPSGLNPALLDIDGDGIGNALEVTNGTDPFNSDTDGDGFSDSEDAFALDDEKWLVESGNGADTTGPVILLFEPTHAVPVP